MIRFRYLGHMALLALLLNPYTSAVQAQTADSPAASTQPMPQAEPLAEAAAPEPSSEEPIPEVSAQPLAEEIPAPEPARKPKRRPPAEDPLDEFLGDLVNELEGEKNFPISFHMLFSGGYQRSTLGEINPLLEAQGYRPFAEDMFSAGGSIQMIAWNVIAEFEGMGALTMPTLNNDYWLNLTTSQAFFNLGYQFRLNEHLSISPLIGIGASTLELNFLRRSALNSFDEFLLAPTTRGQLLNHIFALNFALGLDWHWGWIGKVGLRGGYILNPLASNWWSSPTPQYIRSDNPAEFPVANGPDMRMNGPYLRLMVGF